MVTHIKPGQDFFSGEHAATHKAFGFHGSLNRANARNHVMDPSGEEDGATYVERRAKGGHTKKREKPEAEHFALGGMVDGAPSGRPPMSQPAQGQPTGGMMQNATISMPVMDMAKAAAAIGALGRHAGATQAVNGLAAAARARMAQAGGVPGQAHAMAAAPQPPVAQQGVPAMAKGGHVFRPGGEKGKLHRELGVPEGDKIPATRVERATHSDNPEVRRDAIRAETMKKWGHPR